MRIKTLGGRRFIWEEYNPTYGPWLRMKELDKEGISTSLKVGGKRVEAVVQPDMDREGWYWSVRFAAYRPKMAEAGAKDRKGRPKKPKIPLPERKIGGRAASMEEAMSMAEMAYMTGRPTPVGPVK